MSEQEEFEFRARLEAESAKPAPKPVTGMDRTNAALAGVNRGVLSDLAGLPVDTAANVVDLAKMAVGGGYTGIKSLVTGKTEVPPEWSQPTDRAKVPGSSEWLAIKLNQAGMGGAINNPRPDDQTARVLHSGGRMAGASVLPVKSLPVAQQAKNMAMGALSGVTAGATAEVAPEWAGLAGMLPMAARAGVPAAMRGAIRGGEAGRQNMVERIATLKAGGIDNPSVGLATGNSTVSGIENLLSQTPGSSGLFDRARAANVAGMQAKAEALRDGIASEYGPVVAGEAIQSDLNTTFPARVKASAGKLADKVANLIGPGTVVPVDNSLAASSRLSTPIKGAEASSADLINPRIARLADNLRTDVYGPRQNPAASPSGDPTANLPQRVPTASPSLWNAPAGVVQNADLWNIPTLPQSPLPQRANVTTPNGNASLWNQQKQQGLPFSALKALRSSIGEESASTAIMGTPEQKQFKQLYAAMSDDMRRAADASDRTQAWTSTGPLMLSEQPAMTALNRANRHFSTAMTRAEELGGLAKRDTPEGAFKAVSNSLQSGPTVYERLRSAVTPETRQKVAATVVDELGRATPGQQNAGGDVWSPRTFLTNYHRLYRNDGGAALFTRLPGGAEHAQNLAKIAKASEMLGDGAKVWSNPSGTSQALVARGALGTIGAGAVGGIFYTPLIAPAAVAAGTLGLAHQVSQRLLLNPKFVNWLAKAPVVKTPQQTAAYAQQLMMAAKIENDPQFEQDAQAYLSAVTPPSKQIAAVRDLPRKP